jgi:hypothetical protein
LLWRAVKNGHHISERKCGIRAIFTYLGVFDDEGGMVSYGLRRDIIEKICVSK